MIDHFFGTVLRRTYISVTKRKTSNVDNIGWTNIW